MTSFGWTFRWAVSTLLTQSLFRPLTGAMRASWTQGGRTLSAFFARGLLAHVIVEGVGGLHRCFASLGNVSSLFPAPWLFILSSYTCTSIYGARDAHYISELVAKGTKVTRA